MPQPNYALPTDDDALVRIRDVQRVYPVCRTTLYEQIKSGVFPAPHKIGPTISAWRVGDVRKRLAEVSNAA